jgi:hypothetical protein
MNWESHSSSSPVRQAAARIVNPDNDSKEWTHTKEPDADSSRFHQQSVNASPSVRKASPKAPCLGFPDNAPSGQGAVRLERLSRLCGRVPFEASLGCVEGNLVVVHAVDCFDDIYFSGSRPFFLNSVCPEGWPNLRRVSTSLENLRVGVPSIRRVCVGRP